MEFNSLKAQLIQLAKANDNIELLWLYGSHAKGCAHENSDIDLAVAFKAWESDAIERRLRPELLALDWQNTLNLPEGKLSVLDIDIAPIPLAMSVLKNGELWLSKNDCRLAQELQRIMSKWEIDYLYHYQKQQLMSAGNG
ncbi:nucleotidyltransferase domain-containing protein [Methylomonas sp. SURF-2]|uniref:Nucleotidyltransferase domain-containing protein n=1 Tax=Methylomonas subterranea TaxID=2952225 RepID=A0ABT1TCC4_9GAMM|nr:nucleotidyltransferase domain-containing protein [Methylomonas sp. SURF-2]MCQ8103065.1 nucleotidyltransferase domain-containing protein [Methylomonas sp. SURF-2]